MPEFLFLWSQCIEQLWGDHVFNADKSCVTLGRVIKKTLSHIIVFNETLTGFVSQTKPILLLNLLMWLQ